MREPRRIAAALATSLVLAVAGAGWAGCSSDDVNNAVTDAQNKADDAAQDIKDKANEIKKDAQEKYDDATDDKGK